jgi:hypothetical protein
MGLYLPKSLGQSKRRYERKVYLKSDSGCHLYPKCLDCPRDSCYLDDAPRRGGYPGPDAYSKPPGRPKTKSKDKQPKDRRRTKSNRKIAP